MSAPPADDDCAQPVAPVASAAPRGEAPNLPDVRLEKQTILFDSDSYTVWGASYYLRSRYHRKEVSDDAIRISGYVTKTNLAEAPSCAVHPVAVADPQECHAPLPAFWLGDRPDAAESDCILVLGFASSFAQLYEAITLHDRGKASPPYVDALWGTYVPEPLPVRGAFVKVAGRYGVSFTKASFGARSEPVMGILSFEEMLTLQPANELATLPGLRRKP